ncbi:uncharacterized protein LOC126743350 [Anthonomus grandis grandis]|uniref:uncharacterized protein LOC126743350 n=1 Tax=Anthonomus grandis grandis TaxID=2921223 RepID=UPI002165F92A|nr:uncharacterized protein LOC126743350 [Anthonomus grandis grandis]
MSSEKEITEPPPAEPPAHLQTDWDFFLKQLNTKSVQIESYFYKATWKDNKAVQLMVSHIYDLSHFWVVSQSEEVDLIHKYLFDFYSKHQAHYKVPREHFKLGMYCITYTEGAYYRSILVNIPLKIATDTIAFVFLVDFGFMARVQLDQIYFMTKALYNVPQFSIRACLSGLGPVGSETWSMQAIERFSELVSNKPVYAQITHVNEKQKTIFVRLGEYDFKSNSYDYINDVLIRDKLARLLTEVDIRALKHADKKRNQRSGGARKARLPFSYPSFEVIEKGGCVDSLAAAKKLRDFSVFFFK